MPNKMKIGTILAGHGNGVWFSVLILVAVITWGDINQATKSVFADKLEPGVMIVLRMQALMAENNQSVGGRLLHDPESRQAGPMIIH